jgi:hypothetical protein
MPTYLLIETRCPNVNLPIYNKPLILSIYSFLLLSMCLNRNLIISNFKSGIIFMIGSEVSPARLRYELPKLGIAGSNPALRTFFNLDL